MIIAIHVNVVDIVVGVIILAFFFGQLKKKGDENHLFPKLDSIFKVILVIGSHNNVNTKKRINIKH